MIVWAVGHALLRIVLYPVRCNDTFPIWMHRGIWWNQHVQFAGPGLYPIRSEFNIIAMNHCYIILWPATLLYILSNPTIAIILWQVTFIYLLNPYLAYGFFFAVSPIIPMATSTKLPHLVAGSWASPRSWHDACAAVASGNPLSAWGEGSGDSAGWWRSPSSCEESWKLTFPLENKNMVFWCVLILVRGFVHAVTYAFIIYIYIYIYQLQ